MENYKVKVNNEAESEEVQELFFALGFTWYDIGQQIKTTEYVNEFFIFAYGEDMDLTHSCDKKLFSHKTNFKELTIPELRDMVVLNRNSEEDANYTTGKTKFYQGSSWYKWDKSISKWIEYIGSYTDLLGSVKRIPRPQDDNSKQRPKQPEELPFIDDETQQKHSHYFKDVSDVAQIDVYDVLLRFGVTDPCLQHIVKKALCAGNRGHKDFKRDLQDIADTAQRALSIHKV